MNRAVLIRLSSQSFVHHEGILQRVLFDECVFALPTTLEYSYRKYHILYSGNIKFKNTILNETTGSLLKMKSEISQPIKYYLPIGSESVNRFTDK